ncbi:hypothetical protein ALO82_200357 [Pseudomonas syringae pv. broussonetiae]|nr:hypothetical protein ALO82_200357 [Pseudomonas syringae pv. broussonetiae]
MIALKYITIISTMNKQRKEISAERLKDIYYLFLLLTPIPVFLALHTILALQIPNEISKSYWIFLFLSSTIISKIITAEYRKIMNGYVYTNMYRSYAHWDILLLVKSKPKFKTVQHINNSQIKHFNENRTRFHERNNRTIRRKINIKRSKQHK